MGLHQTKKLFCAAKETIIKMKRQPNEWEKIFANDISEKRLTSKIYKENIYVYKELIQLNIRKQTTALKNEKRN